MLEGIMLEYAPNKQTVFCRDRDFCFFGDSPTLAEINRDINSNASVAWLVPQITNVAEFSNCKNAIGAGQLRNCAEIISSEYYYLKLTELMLFFYRLKSGCYGQFYGSVSPMMIMCSLRQFQQERAAIIRERESRLREAEEEKHRQGAITLKQWLEIKKGLTNNKVQQ